MIEAMARGLPCVGSTVGGIPELLPCEDLVAPADISALVERLRQVTGDSIRMTNMSTRNLDKSRQYQQEILAARRRDHYRYLRETTEAWFKVRRGA
jgi:glycosyltransferase involved in cell wall biosynthesis